MRCGAFGDMVLVSALIRRLALRFQSPVDVITSGPWSRPLLAAQPDVGEVFTLRSRHTLYWLSIDQHSLVNWLRQRAPGPVWFADPGTTGRDLLRRAGIADDWVCEYAALQEFVGEHLVTRMGRLGDLTPSAWKDAPLVDSLANKPLETQANLQPAPFRAQLGPWLQKYGLQGRRLIAIQVGNKRTMRPWFYRSSASSKYWPEERWAAVLRGLRSVCPDCDIVLLGVPSESRLNTRIAALSALDRVHNLADDLPIEIMLPLLEICDSMISVDTGPAHAAAALGCPTVALFGTAIPTLYRPGGITTPAVALQGIIDGQLNILGITPDQVVSAWRELTAKSPSRRSPLR